MINNIGPLLARQNQGENGGTDNSFKTRKNKLIQSTSIHREWFGWSSKLISQGNSMDADHKNSLT